MRMKLFDAEIITASGTQGRAVVAPSNEQATQFIRDHYRQIGERVTKITTYRIDTELEPDDRLRLDDLLETAPVCYAVFVPAVGWLPDHTAVTSFRLFKIEEHGGPETFVIAPNADVAAAVWGESISPVDDESRLFRIHEGAVGLSPRQSELLAIALEFGPVGVATWDEDEGWKVRPPA